MSALTLQNRITVKALSFGRTGSDDQPKPAAAVALSSQYRVCSSVQPGTA